MAMTITRACAADYGLLLELHPLTQVAISYCALDTIVAVTAAISFAFAYACICDCNVCPIVAVEEHTLMLL